MEHDMTSSAEEMAAHDFNMDFGSMPMHFLAQGDDPPVIMIPETFGASNNAMGLLDAVDGSLEEDGLQDVSAMEGPSLGLKLQCSACAYSTDSPRAYLVHVRGVHQERMQIYECPHCPYATRHGQKMIRHVAMVHDPGRQGRRKPGPPSRTRDDYYLDFVKEIHKRQAARVVRKERRLIRQQEQNVAAAARAVAAAAARDQVKQAPAATNGKKKKPPPTATVTLHDLEVQRQREERERGQRLQQHRDTDDEDDDEDRLVIDNDVDDDDPQRRAQPPTPPRPPSVKAECREADEGLAKAGGGDRLTPPPLFQRRPSDQSTTASSASPPPLLRAPADAQGQDEEEVGVDLDPVARLFKCSSCNFTSRTASLVTRHEGVVHLKRRFFRCSRCTYVTPVRSRYEKHFRCHSLPVVKCSFCDFATPYRWNLDRHLKNHNQPEKQRYACRVCNFTTHNRQTMTVHQAHHHDPPLQGSTLHNRRDKRPPPPPLPPPAAPGQTRDVCRTSSFTAEARKKRDAYRMRCGSGDGESEPDEDGEDQVGGHAPGQAASARADGVIATVGTPAGPPGSGGGGGSDGGGADATSSAPTSPPPEFLPSTAAALSASSASGAVPNVRLPHHQVLRCSLCEFRTPFFADMSRHMSTVHASKRAAQGPPTLTRAPVPKLTIRSGSWAVPHTAPVPVSRRLPHPHLQPQQGPPPTKRPAKPLPNLIPLQAAVLPRTTTSPSPSPAPSPTPTSTPTAAPAAPPSPTNGDDPFDAKKNSFFDQLRLYPGSGAGTSADDDSQLVCVHCGHEAKTQSELVRHNKLHQGGGRSRAQGTSTRCQHCRHRCKTSADLALHLRSCVKAAAAAAPAAAAEDADAALDDSTRLTTESEMEYQITAAASAGEPAAAEDADDDDVDHPCPPDDAVAVASDDQVGVETAPGYGLVTSNADLAARAAKENVSTPAITTRKVFKCPYCPFWAATASRFHVHMVGHLNKKPFACSTCKYRSNWRWDITKHIRIKQERDPIHSEAKILMTDDTGRRNYSKYYQHLLWLKCAEPSAESLPPSMTSSQPAVNGSHITSTPPEPVPILPAPPRLTRAPAPRSVIQAAPATLSTQLRPPPPLQAAGAPQAPAQVMTTQSPSERAVQKQPQQQAESPQQLQSFKRPAEAPANNMGPDPKKSNADIKKTVWRCKQCHFRDGDRAVVLAHVKGHYRQQQEAALAKLKNPPVIQGQNSMDGSQTVIKKAPFRCDICPFVSVSDSVMQTHMGCHKERSDVLFKCFYCPFYVSTKQEVIQHMAVHPQQNSKTEIMNSSVLNSTATPRNVATPQTPVSGTEQIQVKKEVEQESPSDVKQQKQSSHRLQLPTLDFSNMTEAPFCWVLKEERLQKMLRCRFCPHINQRRANMQEHEKMHSKRSDGGEGSGQYSPYPCPDCTYVCNNAGVLSTHMKVHLPINPHAYAFYDPYRSESLQMKEIAEQFGLKLKTEKPPQKSSPPKETSDVGNENKLSGINVMSLLDPNQSLTDAVLAMKKKFNLELDGEPFAEPVEDLAESSPCSPLKQLIDPTASNVPEEKELYFCHLCPARFLFRKELGIHSRFHNLHLVHTCDNCSYTSRQRSHMECHVKVHTEDYQDRTTDLLKMYKVNKEFPMPRIVCVNHKAGTVGNVWIVIEAPESPPPAPKFSCSKCPATFYKTEAYQAHVMLHGSNNPHKCRICDYAVKTYGNLIKHMISHGCRASVAKKILQGRMEVPESLRPKTGTLQESESSTPQIVPKEEPQPPEDAENQNGAESMETECGTSTEADGIPMKEDLGMDVDDHHNVAYGEKSDSEVKDKENSPAETALSTNDSAPASGSPEFVYPTHFRNGRVKAKKYKCPKCPSAFEKRHQYHVHLKLHGSKQRYKCTKCDYSVKFYANFKQHLLRHQQSEDAKGGRDDSESSTNEGEEAIPENSENVRSLTPPSPSRSAKTTGGKGEKLSVADQQAIMVLQQRRAKRAAISRESLDKNYWCSHCPYSNPRRDQVESHMRRHIAVSGVCNTFVCDHCDYSVPNKHFLRDHCKLHFDVSKAPRPDAYMICDSLELYASSGFIGKGKSKGKMLIFQDKGFNATSDRFIPPLPSDTNEDSTDAADRIYINLKTFESERFCDNGSKDNADDSREVENNPEFEKEADAEQSEESAEESSSKCGLEDCHESPHSTECGISEADLTQVASSVSVEAGKLD